MRNHRALLFIIMFVMLILATAVLGQAALATEKYDIAASSDLPYGTYMPIINTPLPMTITLVPFVSDIDTTTITDITHAGDERIFVVEREGRIRIVMPNGNLLPEPFLDISGDVKTGNWEQGLLGLAFHPDYPNTPEFYVQYTGDDNKIRIARFHVNPDNPNQVEDPNHREILLKINKPSDNQSPVHNGGDLAFGPDGYLYIAFGDGGPDPSPQNGIPGDPNNFSQRTTHLLGKMLRIDVDPDRGLKPECGNSDHYSIPSSNPMVGKNGCDEIWASGLRNPWRFSFDRLNNDLYIADVGEWKREEINVQPNGSGAGWNYGWHCREGWIDYTTIFPSISHDCGEDSEYVYPVYEYDHSDGCSITGGFVYRGSDYPALYGRYVFADLCTGLIWTLSEFNGEWSRTLAQESRINISTFGEDVNGEMYAGRWQTSSQDNTLYRVTWP